MTEYKLDKENTIEALYEALRGRFVDFPALTDDASTQAEAMYWAVGEFVERIRRRFQQPLMVIPDNLPDDATDQGAHPAYVHGFNACIKAFYTNLDNADLSTLEPGKLHLHSFMAGIDYGRWQAQRDELADTSFMKKWLEGKEVYLMLKEHVQNETLPLLNLKFGLVMDNKVLFTVANPIIEDGEGLHFGQHVYRMTQSITWPDGTVEVIDHSKDKK